MELLEKAAHYTEEVIIQVRSIEMDNELEPKKLGFKDVRDSILLASEEIQKPTKQ